MTSEALLTVGPQTVPAEGGDGRQQDSQRRRGRRHAGVDDVGECVAVAAGTVQQQLDGLKEACRTCMETQKKDYDAKRTAIPDLGFSAASMMDPFAGLSTSPMMDPFAGIDMGDAPVEEPKPAAPAPAPEPVKEDHVEDTAFEGFALGDYSGIEVTDAMVTVEAAPEVDKEKVTRLQSVGEALWCAG